MTTMESEAPQNEFTALDLDALRIAKAKLKSPHLSEQIANLVGTPIEQLLKRLPKDWNSRVGQITHTVLLRSLDAAIYTLGDTKGKGSKDRLHKVVAVGLGAAGGAAGFASVLVELPISTSVILRSIADIAQSEGHDLARVDVRLACLEVFSLGGTGAADDAVESGYWAVRGVLARSLAEAAAYIAEKGFVEEGAPPLVKVITKIASRYSTLITQQAAAKAVPIVGAVSGGALNLLFMNHFQQMARGHFIIKRLEAQYGTEVVKEKYLECSI